ncbi:HDOD domain-containing protein [Pseudomonas indica]|uniref:HDOD domain-containing protein n=1 Tax=Pseudomonas indica TaxID=137658 RepID=UPI0023F912D2|nr:HDOD domain-containing protein [Pseudomonas indica]MBU3056335.1 HDOD domain-containing protein [Pseudomonas indica]
MTPQSLPRSLDAWVKYLDAVRLPISEENHAQVLRALGDSRRSLREIADLLQDTPAMALVVLREANSHGSQLGEPAESLEVALTRLGLKRAETLLQRLPARPHPEIPSALRQLQLISQHATQQANGLFAARLARLWQEIHWGSLLFLAPLWPLAAAQPHLLETWEQRVMAKGEPATKVEHDLFGTALLPLCLALAERWRLPDWIIQGYRLLANDHRLLVKALHIARDNEHPLQQQHRLDDDPPLRRWLTQPANTILLANGLALSAHQAWDSPHLLRWQRLAGLYLQLPLGDVQQAIHQQAAQSARQHAELGLWHPAEALLWPWNARHLNPQPAIAPIPTSDALGEWRKQCAQLLQDPTPFTNVPQLTACAGAALEACGLKRIMLLLADRQHSRLQAQFIAGLPRQALGLSLDPAQSQVLRRLLAEPGQLRLTPTNTAQFSAMLPGNLKSLFSGDQMLLRSLANNGRVVMLLVADQNGAPFAEVTLQAFTKTAQCIERALGAFARRSR